LQIRLKDRGEKKGAQREKDIKQLERINSIVDEATLAFGKEFARSKSEEEVRRRRREFNAKMKRREKIVPIEKAD